MSGDDESVPSKKQKLSNETEENGLNHVGGEEEVENDQEFLVQATTSPGYSGGEEMEEDDEEEEEEGDESMGEEEKEGEEESEEEGQIDSSNAQNIFEVKAFTDLIFSDGNFKEGDDLKNSIDFSETCVQQMFGKDILNEDPDEAGSNQSGESSRPPRNGTHTDHSTDETAPTEKEDGSPTPHTPSRRGRPRKRKKCTPTSRKRGEGGKKREGEVDGEDFPSDYLLSTGIESADMEELKLGYTVLQDIMCQACSEIFLNEPQFSEVGDKIEYDQLVDRPMWFSLVEQNLCKGAYRTLSDLMCDIRVIVENCYKFWKLRDDDMLRAAFKLEDCLLQRLVLLPEDVQKRVSWDLDAEVRNEDTNGMDNGDVNIPKNFTVQDIRNKSKLFRLVESSASKSQCNTISKESLEADIVDFENNIVFADGNTIIETVNSMWELADIGHFLSLTHSLLRVPQPTQLEVERMFLVPQSSIVLARLMTSLLVRPISRVRLERGPPMPYTIWKSRLQAKVSEWYRVYHAKQGDDLEVFETIGIDPMFWNILGQDYNPLESHDYHELHYFQRVWLFKGLCSYVLHNHKTMIDLFNSLPPSSARLPPLGTDRQGNAYFFYSDFIDVRLYRQNMPRGGPGATTQPSWVGNYLLLPLHLQQAELDAHRSSYSSNPRTPYNPVQIPLEERELFFPKQKFLPSRRKDNLVILANSVEGLEILLGELKSERQDPKLIQSMEEVHKALKKRENNIDYVTYKARCSLFTEYNEFMKRPDNYEDPDLKYWTFKMHHLVEEREGDSQPPSPSHQDNIVKENGEDNIEEGGVRRSRRESHPVHLSQPALSDLDSEEESGSEEGGADFEKDGGSSDEWAPADAKNKKKLVFSKPPAQSVDDKIRPASPDADDLDQMTLQPPQLSTPESSPAKPEMVNMEDPLNIASLKRELVEGVHSTPPPSMDPPTPPSGQASRPMIKVKSNQSLVREDLGHSPGPIQLPMAPEQLLTPPQVPLLPPLDVDPLATRLNVKREEEVDDDIEVLEEKVLKPPQHLVPNMSNMNLPPGMMPGENSIMKIGNLVYQIRPGGPEIGPGTMIRMPASLLPPGMRLAGPGGQLALSRGVRAPRPSMGDPTQQLLIQNPRTLAPPGSRGRGRPAVNGAPRGGVYRMPQHPLGGSPRGMNVMRGSPRGMSPRGRGAMLNLTPRKATPPPIPRQLLNRNISVSLVEPKPKPALPKLTGVTITPTKQKASPAKTLIFNSSMSPSSSSLSKSPVSQKTQMVDANVQIQWGVDGSTNYVIELANNQTQALTKEQVQFFKSKHNGTMPNVVRIAVPVDIARRVKPPCITL